MKVASKKKSARKKKFFQKNKKIRFFCKNQGKKGYPLILYAMNYFHKNL